MLNHAIKYLINESIICPLLFIEHLIQAILRYRSRSSHQPINSTRILPSNHTASILCQCPSHRAIHFYIYGKVERSTQSCVSMPFLSGYPFLRSDSEKPENRSQHVSMPFLSGYPFRLQFTLHCVPLDEGVNALPIELFISTQDYNTIIFFAFRCQCPSYRAIHFYKFHQPAGAFILYPCVNALPIGLFISTKG